MGNEKEVISFGTDGWRGVIADNFTFANVERVAKAIGAYALTLAKVSPVITVGYDTRFHSKRFARTVAEKLAGAGCTVILSSGVVSTPALSSSVVDQRGTIGIMLSASHNPPEFNGIKIKTSKGCSAPENVTRTVESLLGKEPETTGKAGGIKEKDFTGGYWRRLKKFVDFDLIRKRKIKVVADPMYGAGIGYLEALLRDTACTVSSIHAHPDPLFGGLHPEPIEEYLGELKGAVVKNKAAAGLATDGDADRIGVVDEKGRYLTPHQVFPLILYYLCKYKGRKGKVVQAISMGYLSERIAKDFNLDFEEVPVGFKFIAERIINGNILMGGEESGGYGYGDYLPERDGILNSLMIIEMLAELKRPLSRVVAEVEKKYGSSCYLRTDFINPGIPKMEFVETMKQKVPDRIAGLKVKQVKDYDGIEFIMEDDSWLLLRPSGTEPVIRVYSESDSYEKTRRIIGWGNRKVSGLRALGG
jgi:phosphomannomutase